MDRKMKACRLVVQTGDGYTETTHENRSDGFENIYTGLWAYHIISLDFHERRKFK